MTATATTKRPITLGLFSALSRLAKGAIDDAAVAVLVGDAAATTYAEVGRFLGVAANTIKTSWAPEGMPGQQGNYPIAAIVAWRLRYLAELENRKLDIESLSARRDGVQDCRGGAGRATSEATSEVGAVAAAGYCLGCC
jgi:hypothetical protein